MPQVSKNMRPGVGAFQHILDSRITLYLKALGLGILHKSACIHNDAIHLYRVLQDVISMLPQVSKQDLACEVRYLIVPKQPCLYHCTTFCILTSSKYCSGRLLTVNKVFGASMGFQTDCCGA